MLRVILFDLDGTLMETAPEIADAINDTLQRRGHAAAPLPLVRSWIGDGAQALLGKALAHAGEPAAAVAEAWAGFAQDYERRCGTNSEVHAGVPAMLQRLRQRDLQLVLLTNKEAAFTQRLLARHGLVLDFDLVVAGDTLPVKKPHPGVVQHALAALHCRPEDAMLVGDSHTDVATARAAGVPVWLVRHGYLHAPLADDQAPDGYIEHFGAFDPQALHAAWATGSAQAVPG